MNRIIIFLVYIFIQHSCTEKKKADTLLYNATFYTADDRNTIVRAIAIKESKIVGLGLRNELISQYNFTEEYDLKNSYVYPGFNDAHCHFYGLGLSMQIANLMNTRSWDAVLDSTITFHEINHKDYILGRGWDQNDWDNKAMPDNTLLDSIFPDIPVVLRRIDGHAAVANSKALAIAEITPSTNIDGGIVHLKNGKCTGLLIDNAAEAVMKAIPSSEAKEIKEALLMAQEVCLRNGLTSVSDAGLTENVVAIIHELQNKGELKIRIDAWLSADKSNYNYIINTPALRTPMFNLATVKLYADGAMGSRGACLLHPYSDDIHNRGLMLYHIDSIQSWLQLCYDHNYQAAVHCIGDSANRVVLQLYKNILQQKNDRRWRIEHTQLIAPSDIDIFGMYNIIPSVQPTHATSDMYWVDERLGYDRLSFAYAYNSLLQQNNWMPLGTDFPVEQVSPILTYYAAITRTDKEGFPAGGFQIQNALSKEAALKGMTTWAAQASFDEDIKGKIQIGMYADFTVLDKDIMTIDRTEILNTKVLATIINGKFVYNHTE